MRAGSRAGLLALTAILLFSAAAVPALAADPVELIDVETGAKTVGPGGNVTFEWTIRNLDTIPYDVKIEVVAVEGWAAGLSSTQITALAPNRAAAVVLSVVAPASVSEETTATFLVRFEVSDSGAVVFIAARSAEATIPSALAEKLVLGALDNPLPAPLNNEWGVFLLDVVLWLAVALVLRGIIEPVAKWFTSHTKTHLDEIILRIVRTPLAVLLFLYGTLNSLHAIDAHLPAWVISGALVLYAFGSSLVFFYLGYRIFRDVFLHIAKNIAKRTSSNFDEIFIPIVEKIGFVVLAFAALGLLLGFLNVDLTLFVAGGVVTSMVVAFAAQDTLSNFFAGMFLLTDRPFKEGDTLVLSDGDWVEVRRIGMRTTRMFRMSDAALITIPNNKLVNEKIANFSNLRDQGRLEMRFNAAYGTDVAKAKAIIVEVIGKCPHVVKQDPYKPVVRFESMADSGLRFYIMVWIDNRDNRFAAQDFLNSQVYTAFGAAGIEIPVPQRKVHLAVGGETPSPATAERVKERLSGRGKKGGAAPGGARTGESEDQPVDPKGEPTETVGDLFEEIVGPATTAQAGSPLIDAVRQLLTVPVTRKVYVVDGAGKPIGTLTLEDLMRNVSARLGTRDKGMPEFLKHLKQIQSEPVDGFARKPRPISKKTRLVEVAWSVVDEKLNDFPVVDESGNLVGELNSQRLLEVVLSLLEDAAPAERPL